jgi:hypothetical protein
MRLKKKKIFHRNVKILVERKLMEMDKKRIEANSTWCSQAVTHPSTDHDLRCLTSVIRRELAGYSTWYGRWRT